MDFKRILALFISLAIIVLNINDVSAADNNDIQELVDTHIENSYIESSLDNDTPVYLPEYNTYAYIPTSFPENMSTITSNYPSYRNQNPYGTCWAFASTGLAEFDLINDGSADKNINLSELALAYFTYNSVTDPLGGTVGDYTKYYNENASVSYLNYGGNFEMASRRYAQWVGPVNESLVPYSQASGSVSKGLDDSYAYGYDEAHLQNAYLINIKKNADDVKKQIMEHGAVGIMYYHDNYSLGWNDSIASYTYHDDDYSGGGHAVMVVGWDDDFSKDNFTAASKPENDGAWLVRNSWGIYASYFWMSYETCSLADTAWVFDFSANDGLDNNYQLDGGVTAYPDRNHRMLANVFTAQQKSDNEYEELKAVSLSFTTATSVSYTIDVYTDLQNESNPISGTKQESATTTGTTAYAGIYTIPLENSVKLTPGSKFAIVVSLDSAVLDYEQATSISNENFTKTIWDCAISIGNNKSFYYSGNRYYPFYWGNYSIKAFTSNRTAKNRYSINYELNGGINNADNPVEYEEENEAIVLKEPYKEGYKFVGWYTDSDFKDAISQIPANSSKEYVLYAKWEKENAEIICQAHIQNYGWMNSCTDGEVIGTTGLGLRLEAFKLKTDKNKNLSIRYTSYVQDDGWQDIVKDGEISGTVGCGKKIQAVMLSLNGAEADKYNIWYRVHLQDFGWLNWTSNGEAAGSIGYDKQIEAMQVVILPKEADIDRNYNDIYSVNDNSYISDSHFVPSMNFDSNLQYQTHVQNLGWLGYVREGNVGGTTGQGLRIEALDISLNNKLYEGSIKYTTHVQNYGWMNNPYDVNTWVENGQISGTIGQGLQVEALGISLNGEISKHYDIYYRVHSQNYGWLAWAKNGEIAGTSGLGYRMEAIQIVMLPKGNGTPDRNYRGIYSVQNRAYID